VSKMKPKLASLTSSLSRISRICRFAGITCRREHIQCGIQKEKTGPSCSTGRGATFHLNPTAPIPGCSPDATMARSGSAGDPNLDKSRLMRWSAS
jgi:hypothetical protein